MVPNNAGFIILTKYVLIEEAISNAIGFILSSPQTRLEITNIKEQLVIYLDKYSELFYLQCLQIYGRERLNSAMYIVEPEVDYLSGQTEHRVLTMHQKIKIDYNSHYLAKAIIKNKFKPMEISKPSKDSDLTNRERAVVTCVCSGLRDKEIAGKLGISINTVKSHTQSIFLKYQVNNRVELVLKGL